MGSLVKLFEGQNKVWHLGKTITGFLSHNQSSIAEGTKAEEIRRPPSVFAAFYQKKVPGLREQYPALKPTQLMKLASSMWKTESAATHQLHKQEYQRKLTLYKNSLKDAPQIPRRPNPPFVQFFLEKNASLRYQYPSIQERTKKASEMWKELSMLEKQRYKLVFKNQMNNYTKNLTEADTDLIKDRRVALNSKRQKREYRKYGKVAMAERPIVPAKSSYAIFLAENAGTDAKYENFMTHMSQIWRNMSAEQKSVYKEKVNQAMQTYKKDLLVWKEKYDPSPKE